MLSPSIHLSVWFSICHTGGSVKNSFLGEQMFIVDGVIVKNASGGDLVSCVLYTKAVTCLPLH